MIESIDKQLMGYNVVKNLMIEMNSFTLRYDLTLILAESEQLFAKELTVKFEDISQLNLANFGGGLMQFTHLQITKLNDGLERQKYEIAELEEEKIGFRCFKCYIEK